MGLRTKRRAMVLLKDIVQRKRHIGSGRYRPQKARYRRALGYTGTKLPRGDPESLGLSSARLLGFFREAQAHPTINPHTLLVLRHGQVAAECSFSPYRGDVWHVTHSLCKGITALAIGMLADSGKLSLDEKLCDIFPGRLSPRLNPVSYRRFRSLTVRHLLTMTSGVDFDEVGAVTEEDWVKCYFESGVRFEPGTEFSYNSMNSYLLSAIVRERTGQGLAQYLRPRLFVPLGFGRVHWETCPRGIEKGGWGLYLCPEDMAKIGQLLLQKGRWNGRQLVSEAFLREMTRKQVDTPDNMGEQGYGFQVWMGKRPGSFLFNGMLGQNIIVLPDADMVVVTTGGNDCLFKNSTIISLVDRYFAGRDFAPDGPLPPQPRALGELRRFQASARNLQGTFPPARPRRLWPGRGRLPAPCRELSGRSFSLEPAGSRLLPLFTQLLQGNYSTGIQRISFSETAQGFVMTVEEGEEKNHIPLSFGGEPQYATVTVNRESYLVAASACFAKDEDGNQVLKVLLPFVEHSNGRKLKLFFYPGGRAELRLSETPDPEELLRDLGLLSDSRVVLWLGRLAAREDGELGEYAIRRTVEPRSLGRLEDAPQKT